MAPGTKVSEEVLRMFRAWGDETRLRLLRRLRAGEQCVCDLTEELDSRQSLLSFHLRTLKDAGLVTDRRDGRWGPYPVNPHGPQTAPRAPAQPPPPHPSPPRRPPLGRAPRRR